MGLSEFKKKLDQTKGLYRLDLSIAEEREFYLEHAGGEENLKSGFPLMYHAFEKSCRMNHEGITGKQPDAPGIVDSRFQIYDFMSEPVAADGPGPDRYVLKAAISGSFLDKRSALADCAPARPFQVWINGKIFDPDSSRLSFMTVNEHFDYVNQVDRQYLSDDVFLEEEFYNRILRVRFMLHVYDEDANLAPYVYTDECRYGSPVNRAIASIHFDDPAPKKHPDTKELRILYGRTSQNLEYPDYTYSTNNADAHGGKLWTIVPVKGRVTLNPIHNSDDYYFFEKLPDVYEGENWQRSTLQYNGKDWKVFRDDLKDQQLHDLMRQNGNFRVERDSGNIETLYFDLFNPDFEEDSDQRYDWVADIDKASTDQKERICYLIGGFGYNIGIKRKDGSIKVPGQEYQIVCRSVKPEDLPEGRTYYTYEQGSCTVYIPPLHLWWGCHAKETPIRLADGSVSPACGIKAGDRLTAYGNKELTVSHVYAGYEEKLVCIQTDAGHTLRVSAGHPLLKEDGTEPAACCLKAGDWVFAESGGPVTVVTVQYELYQDTVYNFSFEGEETGNYLIAGGLYSGDFIAQNRRKEKRMQPSQKQQQLSEELHRMAEQMA